MCLLERRFQNVTPEQFDVEEVEQKYAISAQLFGDYCEKVWTVAKAKAYIRRSSKMELR